MEVMVEKSHVRDIIKASKGMPLGPRGVLAEVCAMCEYGGQGSFYANNQHLSKTLGLTIPKVSAHLRMLEDQGFLVITGSSNGNGKGRVITPTAALRNAYMSGIDTLTEMIRVTYKPYRNDKATLTDSVINPYRIGNHNSIEQKEEEYIVLTNQLQAARAAVSELEGKVNNLTERLSKAAKVYHEQQQELTALKQENEALATQLASQQASKTDKVSTAFPELGFDIFWDAFDKKKGSKSKSQTKWNRLPALTRRLILNGLEVYKAGIPDKQFQPYPETFLNDKIWEAESYGKVEQPAAPKQATPDPEAERLRAVAAQLKEEPVWSGYTSKPNAPIQVKEPAGLYAGHIH
jgi:DNA-binding MarR family transcriptional regulator/regulator of replication initiation timing